jgi:hypothetical protein
MTQVPDLWVPFNFEANQAFGDVPTREVWEELVLEQYGEDDEARLLDQAKQYPRYKGDIPQYGLYFEHEGETLRDFFNRNGMVPSYELKDTQQDLRYQL